MVSWQLKAIFITLLLMFFCGPVVHAVVPDEFETIYGDQAFVSIATGHAQDIGKAPAVASVITAEEIKEMGAFSLQEVMESVPGLHVTFAPGNYAPIYAFRGIYSEFNPHVLLLINGMPMTNVFLGNWGQAFGDMPVESIKRVEIIRGPGSAVYGADAFAGVINIITKNLANTEDTQSGIRGGSFKTGDLWVQNGQSYDKLKIFSSLEFHRTDGQNEKINTDVQSAFDQQFATSASLAPGFVNTEVKSLDARIDFDYKLWSLNFAYSGRRDIGTGAGVVQALDPVGKHDGDRYAVKFSYKNPTFSDVLELNYQLSYLDLSNRSEIVAFPAGAFAGAFPNGLFGSPEVDERHIRFDADVFYTHFEDHTLRLGGGAAIADLYQVKESKNFNVDGSPKGNIVSVTTTAEIFTSEQDRQTYYAYLQDEWNINADFQLIAGLRFDHYSDFGSTTNPRLALIWELSYETTTKILYGRAFRPPSFAELFNINNPVALGNKNLDPETIDTYEWALDFHPVGDFSTRLNIFYYKMKQVIQFTADAAPATTRTAQNNTSQTGRGLEWEATWKFNSNLKLSGNVALQKNRDKGTGKSVGHVPQQQLYSILYWQAMPNLSLAVQNNWIADRKRAANDPRAAIDDYLTFDFNLRYTFKKYWEFSFIGKNIFDEEVREPSPAPGIIPDDLPLAGRSIYAEVRHSF